MDRRVEGLTEESGVRSVMLLERGIPAYYPTLYGSQRLRRVSTSRQKSVLYSIEVLLNWCECEGIDLEDRFRRGEHLGESDVLLLVDFCAWTAETHKRLLSGVKLLPSSYRQVSRAMAYLRIHAIRDYLNFLYIHLARRKDKSKIAKAVDGVFDSYKPNIKKHAKIKIIELSSEQLTAITEKLLPGHPENPWKDEGIQLRNLLIFSILLETGMRRAELAALYVGDIKGSEVSIYRRHNNPLETRKSAPNVKTGERTIPIPDDLAQMIDVYVMQYRGSIRAARKHPYLLVSHKRNLGQPMTLNAITEVFKSARVALPELKGLTPHKLRHHMNYRISEMIDEHYKDATPFEKAAADEESRSYLMGWSPNSDMQQLYNRRYNQEKAGRMLVERSNKLNRKQDKEGGRDAND
jgi:integrase